LPVLTALCLSAMSIFLGWEMQTLVALLFAIVGAWCLYALWQLVLRHDAIEAELKKQIQRLEGNLARSAQLSTMGELASVMAHELNQPLAAINSYATGLLHLIKNGELNERDIETALFQVQKQTSRASQIINSVHDFVVKREPHRTMMKFVELIQRVLPLIDLQAKTYMIALEVKLDEPLPLVFIDPISIEQVILNLTRNAFQSMQDISGKNRQLRVHAKSNGNLVEVDIIDHGTGISKEIGEQLFSPFFSTKAEGMGMGLNICRTIVESQGGQLTYCANPAGGTIFSFTLPAMDGIKPASLPA